MAMVAETTGSVPAEAGVAPEVTPPAAGRRRKAPRATLLGSAAVVVLVGFWQIMCSLNVVKRTFLPTPLDVAKALGTLFNGGAVYHDLAVSGEEFVLGLAISVAIGGVLGILTGWYKPVDEFFKPIVIGLNSMPQVAVIPILILIFGIGMTPKVIVVVLSCTTVILLNTAAGVANVEEKLMRMSRSFGASDTQQIRSVVLPHLVPFFMTGLRISIGRAMIGVVVGEIFSSKAGIGNLLISASDNFNMPVMYATVVVITVLGIILTQVAAWGERRLQRWKT
jgi:ABC-type nitrate/sulfonate/bicarbonate transport system permease component